MLPGSCGFSAGDGFGDELVSVIFGSMTGFVSATSAAIAAMDSSAEK
jgi:hypothetical protein